jgi:predicted permease
VFGALSGFVVVSVPIVVGYIVARTGILGPDAGYGLHRLVFFVLMPVLIFTVIAEADIADVFSPLVPVSLIAALAMFAVYAITARLAWKQGAGGLTVGALAAGYTNANNIGFPIAVHMLGNPTVVAPIVLMQTVIFAPIALTILDGADGDRRPVHKVISGALVNPIVIGSMAGLAACLIPAKLPAIVMEPLSLVGQGAIPVMLISFGLSLRGRKILSPGSGRWATVTASALKLVGMPLVAWALGSFVFGLDRDGVYAVTVLAALPTAQNVFNYAARYDQSVTLARDAVSITTLGAGPVVLAIAALFS